MKVYRVELKASGIRFESQIIDKEIHDALVAINNANGYQDVSKFPVDRFTNLGPYCGTSELPANVCRWLRENGLTVNPRFYYDDKQHPDPYDDELLRKNIKERREFTGALSSMFYGFASLESLDRWFDDYIRQDLHKAGYVVMVYEAEEAYEGTAQAVFNMQTATPVDIIHLHEFPELEEA